MILEEETYREFGYYPNELLPKSNKKILVICDDCGKVRTLSKSDYRTFCHSCAVKGERNSRFGISLSNETKQKIRDNHVDCKGSKGGNWKGGLVTIKCAICGKEKEVRPDKIAKGGSKYCSNLCKGKAQLGRPVSEKTRAALRNQKHVPIHHTKPEMIFEEICKKNSLPFKYTGDGAFWIGKNPSINPDFVDCDGKKLAVEIFGDYWHSPLLRNNIPYNQTYEGRNKILKEYGWKLVIFWETDLLREDAEQFVLNKLGGA